MTKKEIIFRVAERTEITRTLAREAVQKVFDTIMEVLVESGRLELRDFGVFEVKLRAAHKARNPQTNEIAMVPEKAVVSFKPGKKMEKDITLRNLKKRQK